MKNYLIIFALFISSTAFAQFDLGIGMGLSFFNAQDLQDYINYEISSSEEMKSFNTSADFFVELGYNLNENYQLSAEFTYNLYSFNSNDINGIYDFQLTQLKPSIIGYYLITGKGYKVKLGGGIGFRSAQVEEKTSVGKVDYSTSGFGVLAKVQGDTKLGENIYALIAGELRYDMPGEINTLIGETVNLNTVGVALKLGAVYYF